MRPCGRCVCLAVISVPNRPAQVGLGEGKQQLLLNPRCSRLPRRSVPSMHLSTTKTPFDGTSYRSSPPDSPPSRLLFHKCQPVVRFRSRSQSRSRSQRRQILPLATLSPGSSTSASRRPAQTPNRPTIHDLLHSYVLMHLEPSNISYSEEESWSQSNACQLSCVGRVG
jgi:hypothetical protein